MKLTRSRRFTVNVGAFDRVVRTIFGTGFMFFAGMSNLIVNDWQLMMTCIAIPMMTTVIFAWDPVYYWLGVTTEPTINENSRDSIDAKRKFLSQANSSNPRDRRRWSHATPRVAVHR